MPLATVSRESQHVRHQSVHVFGTDGHLEVEIPFNAPYDRPCNVRLDGGLAVTPDFTVAETSAERAELLAIPAANHYTAQWQAFSAAVRGGAPVRNDMQSAVANMRVIDAVFRAAESQRWETV